MKIIKLFLLTVLVFSLLTSCAGKRGGIPPGKDDTTENLNGAVSIDSEDDVPDSISVKNDIPEDPDETGQRSGKEISMNPDRKSTRLNSSHTDISRMPSSA